MQVTVTKITDYDLLREATEYTIRAGLPNMDPLTMYVSQHSPIRSQIFKVAMDNIPVAYSTHLLRHGIGYDFQGALTHRDDRGGAGDAVVNRLTPTKHLMIVNAQALINLARVRMCFKAHETTRKIMHLIHEGVGAVDEPLARAMVPNCFHNGGVCREPRMCGKVAGVKHWRTVGLPEWNWENPSFSRPHREAMARESNNV